MYFRSYFATIFARELISVKWDPDIIQFKIKLLFSRKPSHRYLLIIVLQNSILLIINYTHVRSLFVYYCSVTLGSLPFQSPFRLRRPGLNYSDYETTSNTSSIRRLSRLSIRSLDERMNASSNGAEAFRQWGYILIFPFSLFHHFPSGALFRKKNTIFPIA